jgi:hypothetical protein
MLLSKDLSCLIQVIFGVEVANSSLAVGTKCKIVC